MESVSMYVCHLENSHIPKDMDSTRWSEYLERGINVYDDVDNLLLYSSVLNKANTVYVKKDSFESFSVLRNKEEQYMLNPIDAQEIQDTDSMYACVSDDSDDDDDSKESFTDNWENIWKDKYEDIMKITDEMYNYIVFLYQDDMDNNNMTKYGNIWFRTFTDYGDVKEFIKSMFDYDFE